LVAILHRETRGTAENAIVWPDREIQGRKYSHAALNRMLEEPAPGLTVLRLVG
jgi:hypothetical protein